MSSTQMIRVAGRNLYLKRGKFFSPSELGKYRFFYPQEKLSVLCKETVKLERVPVTMRVPQPFLGLLPFLVPPDFARNHLTNYQIIWVYPDDLF